MLRLIAKILLVDDRPANLTAYEAALTGKHYELVFARSGTEACALVLEHDFAVIVLDVQMPGLDGFQTARLIRQNERSKYTPIIFVTANYSNESYAMLGYGAGAVDYLSKPFNVEILRAKIDVFVELFNVKVDIRKLRDSEAALKRALMARDEFLSIASHELKTPLTPLQLQMQSFMRMLELGTLNSTPADKLQRMLQISDVQVTRLARLIDQLLDVSRIHDGRLNLERGPVVLDDLVLDVLAQFQHPLTSAGYDVTVDLKCRKAGHWDRLRVEQVVINLLTNAMKYGDSKPITVTTAATESSALLKIRDQGIGIAAADQERIFGRFERAVCAKNFGGLGLGLYISRRIMDLHGGRISVESAPGQGSTFLVELPY